MRNSSLFILSGEAFSGKTTIAKKISEKFGRDVIYFTLDKSTKK